MKNSGKNSNYKMMSMTKTGLLLSMTVLTALTFSSCGKSKTERAPEPVSTTEQPPVVENNGAPAPTQAGDTQLDSPSEIEAPLPAAPTGRPGSRSSETEIRDGSNVGSENNSSAEQQAGGSSVLRPPLAESKESSAVGLTFSEAEAAKTGGQSAKDKLFYTSAGRDGLMAYFRKLSTTVNAEQQKMNSNLAKAIISAKLKRVASTGDIFVEVVVDENGAVRNYKLKATDAGTKMDLTAEQQPGMLEFQGGFLKCTDTDGGCENAYAKIKFSGAYARVIFRNSYADQNFIIYKNPALAVNANFELWNSYVLNKTTGVVTNQKMDYTQVSSFEILNGRSGMGIMMMAADQNMVGLSVPLMAPEKGTKLSFPVARVTDLSKSYDLSALAGQYGTSLAQAVSEVKLIANNGLGQLKLMMSFSSNPTDSKVFVDLSRVQKPTLSADEISKFEKAIPFF